MSKDLKEQVVMSKNLWKNAW